MSLQKEVEALALGDIGSVIASPKALPAVAVTIVDTLVKKKEYAGVYVAVSKPYASLIAQFQKRGIDTNSMFFIDMITMQVAGKAAAANNCYYANSPEDVMEIAATLTKIAVSQPSVRFLIIDSIGTLGMYNPADRLQKFVHFMSTALRELKMEGIFLLPSEETDPKIMNFVQSMSDYVWQDDGT